MQAVAADVGVGVKEEKGRQGKRKGKTEEEEGSESIEF